MNKSFHPLRDIRLVESSTKDCQQCSAYIECICTDINPEVTEQIKPLSSQVGPLLEGDFLARRGEPFKTYYLVQSGVIRSETVTHTGRHKVKWFYFPGDLIGMEAMSAGTWPADLVVGRTTLLCSMSVADMNQTALQFPQFQQQLFKCFGERILNQEYALAADFSESSKARVLEYLVHLFERLRNTEFVVGSRIDLPMTKTSLASYLGMTAETLSRILAQLGKEGLITNHTHSITLGDRALLKASIESSQH